MRVKLAIYATLSIVLLLPLGVDIATGAMSLARAAILGPALLACLWSSWPAYRSILLKQATITLGLLVMVNALFTPLMAWTAGETQMVQPDYSGRFEFDEPKLAVLSPGVHLYSTNAAGHRTNRPVDYAHKPAGTLRIAFFGGSTTEGYMLDDQKTWASQLGALLETALQRPVEVINTGVSGTRAEHHLVAFRRSESYRPDIAVFMLGINDWNRDIVHATDRYRAFLDAVDGWRFYQSVLWRGGRALGTAITVWRSGPPHHKEVQQVGSDWFGPETEKSARRPKIHYLPTGVGKDYAADVEALIAECRARKMPCLFVDQPTAYSPAFEADKRLWMTPPTGDVTVETADLHAIATLYNDWLAKTVGRTEFPFCPTGAKVPPPTEAFFDDCHFTEQGAAMVARLVERCLLDAPSMQSVLTPKR